MYVRSLVMGSLLRNAVMLAEKHGVWKIVCDLEMRLKVALVGCRLEMRGNRLVPTGSPTILESSRYIDGATRYQHR